MIREGVDYSGARPTATALRAANRDYVVRYARKTGTLDKQITAAEATYWRDNHIDVAIVDEVSAGRMLAGYAAGKTDAVGAAYAIKAVGGPSDGGVIHFACDVDTTSDAQREAVAEYLRGAASVLGWDRVGVYGEWQVIDWVHNHDKLPVRYLWQTYAWSGGVRHPAATLYQYLNGQKLGGVEVDYCRAYTDDFGQWPTVEDDMTPEEHNAIFFIRDQIAGAIGPGQRDFKGTMAAALGTAQGVFNLVNTKTGALANSITEAKSATLAAVAAVPAAHLDDAQITAIAEAVVAKADPAVGGLTTDEVEAALRHVFADAAA